MSINEIYVQPEEGFQKGAFLVYYKFIKPKLWKRNSQKITYSFKVFCTIFAIKAKLRKHIDVLNIIKKVALQR